MTHLPAGEESTPTQRLHTLSETFFKEYTLAGPEDDITNAQNDPAEALMVRMPILICGSGRYKLYWCRG